MHVFAREASEVYDVIVASFDGRPVALAGGTSLVPDGGLDLLRRAQTVLVPGYADAAETPAPSSVIRALAAAARRGGRIMVSICSGAFALAQAGLLDGHTATTHWFLCADLASQHPEVTVDPSVMFVDDGEVLTSGAVTAGVDLCLHLLNRDLGASVARHVARRIVMTPRPAGDQRQFAETKIQAPGDDAVAAVQRWLLATLGENVTVADMAARAYLSSRSFHRRFADRTGTTPLAWLLDQRIARAKELLVSTDLPVENIAGQVGRGSPANFRAHFRRATSQSPASTDASSRSTDSATDLAHADRSISRREGACSTDPRSIRSDTLMAPVTSFDVRPGIAFVSIEASRGRAVRVPTCLPRLPAGPALAD